MESRFPILCLWILFSMNRGSGSAMVPVFQKMWKSGATICALETPSFSTKTRSRIECGVTCRSQTDCAGFNYGSDKICHVFLFEPQCFTADQTCTHYQISDYSVEQVLIGIPAQNCSFPFTYNGSLYYGCMKNISNPCQAGCIEVKRQWQTCTKSHDYVVEYTTADVTIPNTVGTTPLMSVNNWIVIQQRIDGSVDFNRNWTEYKTGFGDITTNFWLGLEKMYQLTSTNTKKLRIEIQASENSKWFSAEYDTFLIDPESKGYAIHVTGYSGDAGDGLNVKGVPTSVQNGMEFSTSETDNDQSSINCATYIGGGGFWFNNCCYCSLNHPYGSQYFYWHPLTDLNLASTALLKSSRMMMKDS